MSSLYLPTWRPASIDASLNGTQQNDWNPTGWSTATMIWISASSPTTITGLQGGVDGRIAILMVRVGSSAVTLVADSASSSAGNRFRGSSASPVLAIGSAHQGVALLYDGTEARWIGVTL